MQKEDVTMTKIDIFSGFLGAGKTTLIKKLIAEAYTGEQLVLIENEFGEIGIDGGFLQEAGISITEMNSGCICCSLVGDFGKALRQVMDTYHPDRILIEPSGVGKLSDVIRAVQNLEMHDVVLNGFTTVVDATKAKMYMRNFGEFFNNQVEHASAIILSRTAGMSQEKLDACVALLREKNPTATIVTTPWDELDGKQLLAAMERRDTLAAALEELAEEQEHERHHYDDDECGCGCHDHDHDHEHEHHHHHDEDDDECGCGCHDHGHDHEHEHHHHDGECDDPACACHHHHHHADEVFTSWGAETPKTFTEADIDRILTALDGGEYGAILRAKGIVPCEGGKWLHFDYVPQEHEVRFGPADYTGRLCVIGSKLDESRLAELFGL